MKVHIERASQGMIARLSGELDHHTALSIRSQIDCSVEKMKPKTLVLDFSDVGFMDSSGIGLIMGRYKLMNMYKGKLEITGASSRIKKVMLMAGLDKLDVIKDDTEERSDNI